MKTEFNDLKNEFIDLLKDKSPCKPEYKRVLESTSETELLSIIYDNISWCIENNVISHEFLNKFDKDLYLTSGVANTGKENTGYRNSGNRNGGDNNSGDRNSGDKNSGDNNSGDNNSGNRNGGDNNSGYRNSGDNNSGNRNGGYWNSGNWNSGNRNSGDNNSGKRNSGNWNSGNWNSGDRNSGDSNSGYRNSGAFCIDNNPKIRLFDVQTDMGVREWENHPAYRLMENGLNFNFWILESEMSDDEKEENPTYKTAGGYLKNIPYKEGWANFWGYLSNENKKVFTSLPFFDADKFEIITGIKITK